MGLYLPMVLIANETFYTEVQNIVLQWKECFPIMVQY